MGEAGHDERVSWRVSGLRRRSCFVVHVWSIRWSEAISTTSNSLYLCGVIDGPCRGIWWDDAYEDVVKVSEIKIHRATAENWWCG